MKSLLILTDFSEAAFRAAEYACGIAQLLQVDRFILYHAYRTYVGGTEIPIIEDSREVYLASMESLGLQYDRLRNFAGPDVKIEMVAREGFLTDTVAAYAEQENVADIVMGVSGKTGIEALLLGSTTSEILKTSTVPVLVVPADALVGRPVKTVVFATDLKDVNQLSAARLEDFLGAFRAQLHIVNVGGETDEKYTPETFEAITDLHRLLEKYNPAFGYISRDDVVEGILSYAKEKKASMIIAVPKKHGGFSALFHKSVSKKLAYNSSVPLLFLPGIE